MRAKEFITETINKETLNPKFKHSIEDNGITYTAKYIKYGGDGKSYFTITATQEIDNQTVRAGEVMFRPKTDGKDNYWLESYMTWVKPDYRKLGVTRMMYAYAKMLGNDIKPSHDQTPRGKAMWQSWKDSGDAEHLLKEYKKYPTQEFEGVSFTMVEEDGYLTVKALNDFGISMASVIFSMDGKELDPQSLRVDEKYRGQGIARVMYDYVKSRGFIINRSYDQTDAGAGFWNKHRGEERIWEDTTPEILYHVTPTRNVKSILANGLIPSIGQRSAQLETESNLFLFPTKDAAEDAVMNWLGDEFDDEPLSLLAVSSNGLEGKFTLGAEYEYTVSSPIPPQNIKVISTNI